MTAFSVYSNWLVQELHLTMQRIRDLADAFPFYQRRKGTGRPPVSERDLMVCYLVRQIFNATFRQTQGLLNYLADYFHIDSIPDHTVLSKYNRSQRWLHIWQRFHDFVMKSLPKRRIVIATDATGFSGRKRPWREWPHPAKANQDWVKMHAAIETESFYILSYQLTESNVHDSQMFGQVWEHLPSNVAPTMSLADSAYNGNSVIETALRHGAWPLHGIKKNAVYRRSPMNAYQRMVQFIFNFPRTYATFYGKRNHAEATFSMLGNRFGYRLRSRSKTGRKNEVQCKVVCHNIRMLAWNSIKMPVRV
jgi:transposase